MKNRKVPRFYGLRIYLSSIVLYFLLVFPVIGFLYAQVLPQIMGDRELKMYKDSMVANQRNNEKTFELKIQDTLNQCANDTANNGEKAKVVIGYQYDKKSDFNPLNNMFGIFFRMLLFSFILGFAFNLPFKIFFNKKRKNKKISRKIFLFCKKYLLASPLINTGILFLTFLATHLYMGYQIIGCRYSFQSDFEVEVLTKFFYISLIASFLVLLFVYFWERHRVTIKYIDHLYSKEELRKKVFNAKNANIRNRLLVSSLMTTLLPLTIVMFYLMLSLSKIENTNLDMKNKAHREALLGNYETVTITNNTNDYDSFRQFYYVNLIDTTMMLAGITNGVVISILYILFFVRWTTIGIVTPVKELLSNIQKTAKGKTGNFTVVRTNDEIGELTEGFNDMSQQLQDYIAHISKMNLQLEDKVKERTAEIASQKEEIVAQRDHLEMLNTELMMQKEELNSAIENLKETQSQLVQSEKMASLGQLTAGIAHEINNPINFVSSNITPLQLDISDLKKIIKKYQSIHNAEDKEKCLAEIKQLEEELEPDFLFEELDSLTGGVKEGAKRTKEIVQSLRSFSRLEEGDVKLTDIRQGIDSTLTLLRNKIKNRIEIEKIYEDIPKIECYPGKLNQVFMNILNNAIQAIEGNGRIRIHTKSSGDTVRISISDSGKGMTEEVKERIFEPFFTTKDVGKGTGLGLSITYRIIQSHNGSIDVRSEPQKGSEFVITLPVEQNVEDKKFD